MIKLWSKRSFVIKFEKDSIIFDLYVFDYSLFNYLITVTFVRRVYYLIAKRKISCAK